MTPHAFAVAPINDQSAVEMVGLCRRVTSIVRDSVLPRVRCTSCVPGELRPESGTVKEPLPSTLVLPTVTQRPFDFALATSFPDSQPDVEPVILTVESTVDERTGFTSMVHSVVGVADAVSPVPSIESASVAAAAARQAPGIVPVSLVFMSFSPNLKSVPLGQSKHDTLEVIQPTLGFTRSPRFPSRGVITQGMEMCTWS